VADPCTGDCPFYLLIGQPVTGEIMTVDPDYYFHPNNREQFLGWHHEWEIEQIAAGIVMLECKAYPDSGRHLKWEDSNSWPNLDIPAGKNEEHWTSSFQWRVIRQFDHFGFPE
jgi:hypothetical protein